MEKYCPNCKLANSADAMFCRSCATPLPAATQQPNQQQYSNQQQGMGFQPANNFAAQSGSASSRATTAAILAVCGFLCCAIAGIPAAILGWMEINDIKQGRAPAAGMTMAQVGLWGGIIGAVLNIGISVILMIVMSLGGGR